MKFRVCSARVAAFLLSAVLILSSLTACGGEKITPYPVTVGGATVERSPRAVGSLSPSLTRLLIDLGYQDRIVGYSDDDSIPEEVVLDDLTELIAQAKAEEPPSLPESVPETEETSSEAETSFTISIPADWDGKTPLPKEPTYIGRIGTAMEPNLINIGILKPEVIFTTQPVSSEQAALLDEVGIRVVVLPPVATMEELAARVEAVSLAMDGQRADLPAEESGREPIRSAETIAQEMTDELEAICSRLPAERKTFLAFCGEDVLPITGDTFEGALLALLGNNLAEEYTAYTVPAEELSAMRPDVIFYSNPVTPERLAEYETTAAMAADIGDRLISVDQAELLNQTRSVIETVRRLVEQLYPEVEFDQLTEQEASTQELSDVAD